MEPITTDSVVYASFWQRFCASIVDGVILGAISGIIAIGASVVMDPSGTHVAQMTNDNGLLDFLSFIVAWVYSAGMESSKHQATVGKLALSIRVTHENGSRISFGRATGRFFGEILSGILLGIGYLMMLWTDKHQTLHDKLAKTIVVPTPKA